MMYLCLIYAYQWLAHEVTGKQQGVIRKKAILKSRPGSKDDYLEFDFCTWNERNYGWEGAVNMYCTSK